MVKSGGSSLSPLDLDYLCEIVQETISKLPLPYQVLLISIALVIVSLFALNRDFFDRWVESYRKTLNRFLKIAFFVLIICLVAVFIFDYFHSPAPPEDQLVVAISPFYLIDEYGRTGSDKNTADDFKEKIEAQEGLGIKVVLLNPTIQDEEDARFWGKKVGAHLVVYGETKKKIGNIGEIKYYILPLSSLEITPLEMPFLEVRSEEENSSFITEKATFSMVTEEPITIIESLTENASSVIYTIGAFENYKKSDFTSAITFFKSIKNYDNHSSILHYIASCYYFNNNVNESLQYLDKVLEINPQLAEVWKNKGVALADSGRYEEAITVFDKAIEINPQYADAWSNKGLALSYLGRYEEALTACDKAIELNPQSTLAWNNKGVTLGGLGRYEGAIVAFDRAIEINPQNAGIWYNKGNALSYLGRYEEAITAFDKAIEINAQYADAWSNKGSALCYLYRYREAIAAFDRAIEIDPQDAGAWYNKGVAFSYLGRNEEAIAAYDKALQINPQLAEVWDNKGVVLMVLGRNEEALASYDKALKISPQDAGVWNNKGVILGVLGRNEEALASFDRAIEIDPQHAGAWKNKGVVLGKLGKHEEANEAFEKAHEIDPTIGIP